MSKFKTHLVIALVVAGLVVVTAVAYAQSVEPSKGKELAQWNQKRSEHQLNLSEIKVTIEELRGKLIQAERHAAMLRASIEGADQQITEIINEGLFEDSKVIKYTIFDPAAVEIVEELGKE